VENDDGFFVCDSCGVMYNHFVGEQATLLKSTERVSLECETGGYNNNRNGRRGDSLTRKIEKCKREVFAVCSQNEICQIVQGACIQFCETFITQNVERRMLSSSSVNGLVAASLLFSFRMQGEGRTEQEIMGLTRCKSRKILYKWIGNLNSALGVDMYDIGFVKYDSVIPRVCSKLVCSKSVESNALYIIQSMESRGYCLSRRVSSRVAFALAMSYIICKEFHPMNARNMHLLELISFSTGVASE